MSTRGENTKTQTDPKQGCPLLIESKSGELIDFAQALRYIVYLGLEAWNSNKRRRRRTHARFDNNPFWV